MFSSSVVARGRQEPYFIRISSLCLQVQAIGEARIWQGHLAPLGANQGSEKYTSSLLQVSCASVSPCLDL